MSDIRIFISFAEADRIACERVAACLRDAGADVWYGSHEHPGAPDDTVVDAELRSRPLFVVLLSEAAYESPRIDRECRLAVALAQDQPHRRVVPIVVHPTHYVGTWEFLDAIPRLHLYDIPTPLLVERILTPPDASQDALPPDLPLEDVQLEARPVRARPYEGLARAEAHNLILTDQGSITHLTSELMSAVKLAGAKAADRRHPHVEPEHLLFGVVKCPTSGALEVLAFCGAQPPKILTKLHQTLPWGRHPLHTATQASPRFLRVIELADAEAHGLGHHYVCTSHILLGILLEDGKATKLLKHHGVTYEAARAATAHLLQGQGPP